MKIARLVMAAAVLSASAAPGAAAGAPFGPSYSGERSISGFAGANIRLPLGGKDAAKPSARLQITTVHSFGDPHSAAPARSYRLPGLELGLAAKKPALFMMGQDVAKLQEQKLGIDRSTKTLLIVGGLAAVALAVYLITTDCGTCAEQPGFILPQ